MDYDQIEEQLADMLEKGIYEFFVFAEYGLEVPYLSEDWWKRVDFTLKQCKKLGMKVWIYDDYNWPSGTCAGYVLRDHPETKSRMLNFEVIDIKPGEAVEHKVEGEILSVTIQYRDKSIELIPQTRIQKWAEDGVIRHKDIKKGQLIIASSVLYGRKGLYSSSSLWASGVRGYVDVTNQEAVGRFIEYTHQQYKKRYEKYLGTVILGFFTDEPSLCLCTWPTDFLAIFEGEYGYDLREKVHELLIDAGDYLRTRFQYWSLLTKLFSQSYMKQISDWCKKHNLIHTGHLLGEELLEGSVSGSGDIYQVLKWMQAPGLDLLGKEISYDKEMNYLYKLNDPRSYIITAKSVSSTARFTCSQRVMCEVFGVRDWGATLAEQKRMTDWLTALGVDLINDNSLEYSITDFRKRSTSGKHFTTPWWRYYKSYSDYCGRLCLITNKGNLAAQIGVLYPTTNAWAMRPLGGKVMGKEWNLMQEALLSVVDGLLRTHWDFELLFEEVIAKSKVDKGELITSNGRFKMVILPAVKILDKNVYERLEEFLKSGGIILAVETRPELYLNKEAGIKVIPSLGLKESEIISLNENRRKFEADLDRIISHNIDKMFTMTGEGNRDVISAVRSLEEKSLLFLANLCGGPKDLQIRWKGKDSAYLWDPDTGKRFSLCPQKDKKGSKINCHLETCQSLFLVLDKKQKNLPNWILSRGKYKKIMALEDKWQFTTETPNLFLPALEIKADVDGKGKDQGWFVQERRSSGWLKVDEGKVDIELSPEQMRNFWLRCRFTIKEGIPRDLSLIVDSDRYSNVYLNSCRLQKGIPYTLWDKANLKFPLRAKEGENLLVIEARPSIYFSSQIRSGCIPPYFVDPVVLSGSFRVEGKNTLVEESAYLRTGSWTEQGYPNFAGTGVYSQEVKIADLPENIFLKMEEVGDVAEVWVNGKFSSVRPWPPYILDISQFLVRGNNKIIIKITNSFGNLLRRTYRGELGEKKRAGLLENVSLVTFA